MGNDPAGGAPPARRGWQPDPHRHHPVLRTPPLTSGIAPHPHGLHQAPAASPWGLHSTAQHSPPGAVTFQRPLSIAPWAAPSPQQHRWEAGQTPQSITHLPPAHTMTGWAGTPH